MSGILDLQCTVLIRFKATLLNNYKARGRFFWRLKNYVEVLVSHIRELHLIGDYSTVLDYRPLKLHCFLRPGIEAMV